VIEKNVNFWNLRVAANGLIICLQSGIIGEVYEQENLQSIKFKRQEMHHESAGGE